MLPPDIAESHAHLTKLLETCGELPFNDVMRTLRHAFEQERKKGYFALEAFMDRLPTYLSRHLSSEMQTKINASNGLLHSLRGSLRLMASKPENWDFWGISDLPRLLDRRENLIEQLSSYEDTSSPECIEQRQRVARINSIIDAVKELEQTGKLAVNASELDVPSTVSSALRDIDISICPLTGLPTSGQATLEGVHGGYVLYSFRPIGKAFFSIASLKSAIKLFAAVRQPSTDWAGLCREAAELDKKLPIFSDLSRKDDKILPITFDEKKSHFLQLLYLAGGNEFKARNIFIYDDFPLAFAKNAEEFTRILESLISEEWLQYDKPNDTPNDWVRGIRTHYNSVLISREGLKRVKESLNTTEKEHTAQAPDVEKILSSSLIHLHPAVQSVASSRFAAAHYADAILAACTALDKAVQAKSQLPNSTVGTALMTKVFSANKPLVRLSQDDNEQLGFMNLFQGSVQALRNHYAHNLTEISANRALEWLNFISALFHKLNESISPPDS